MNDLGLNRFTIKKIIQHHLDENADLLIGVDDPEVNEMINVLVDAFVEVVSSNNDEISKNIDSIVENLSEKGTHGIYDALGRRQF